MVQDVSNMSNLGAMARDSHIFMWSGGLPCTCRVDAVRTDCKVHLFVLGRSRMR